MATRDAGIKTARISSSVSVLGRCQVAASPAMSSCNPARSGLSPPVKRFAHGERGSEVMPIVLNPQQSRRVRCLPGCSTQPLDGRKDN